MQRAKHELKVHRSACVAAAINMSTRVALPV